jgi:hypothetical protein
LPLSDLIRPQQQWGALINKLLSGRRHLSQWRKKGRQLGTKKKIAIISAYGHTKLKLTFFMLLGGLQNTIKSHLVFTALFCFAPFSVFFSRMSAPYCKYMSSIINLDSDVGEEQGNGQKALKSPHCGSTQLRKKQVIDGKQDCLMTFLLDCFL